MSERRRNPDPPVDKDAPPSTLSNQNYEEAHPKLADDGSEDSEDHRERTGERPRRESHENRK